MKPFNFLKLIPFTFMPLVGCESISFEGVGNYPSRRYPQRRPIPQRYPKKRYPQYPSERKYPNKGKFPERSKPSKSCNHQGECDCSIEQRYPSRTHPKRPSYEEHGRERYPYERNKRHPNRSSRYPSNRKSRHRKNIFPDIPDRITLSEKYGTELISRYLQIKGKSFQRKSTFLIPGLLPVHPDFLLSHGRIIEYRSMDDRRDYHNSINKRRGLYYLENNEQKTVFNIEANSKRNILDELERIIGKY